MKTRNEIIDDIKKALWYLDEAYNEAPYDSDCKYHISKAISSFGYLVEELEREEYKQDEEDEVYEVEVREKWKAIKGSRLRVNYLYLFKTEKFCGIAFYRGKRKWEQWPGHFVEGVTHWAHLPLKSSAR